MIVWLLIISFFGLLFIITLINAKVNGGFKIESSWIAIALAPTIIWLIASGQLSELSGFGVEFKLQKAAARPFSLNLEGKKIQPEIMPVGDKSSIQGINKFIDNRISAMTLTIGKRNYYQKWAIIEYMKKLTPYDFFKYVVFIDQSERFKGMIPAQLFYSQLHAREMDIVRILETGKLEHLNGVQNYAVTSNSNKGEVLEKMAKESVYQLPVINDEKRFIGVIDRNKLTSSIVLDLVAVK